MSMRPTITRCLATLTLLAACAVPLGARANVVNEEKQIYIVRPLTTEPAWTQTGFYANTMMFDLPNAVSHPSAQVGFAFEFGLTWSVLDILELNVGFPLVLNPDATGDREEKAAKQDPSLKQLPYWDSTPDLDLPGMMVGLKANLLGKKGRDRFFLAVGAYGSLPLGGDARWSTNFMPPKTVAGHSNAWRVAPYLALAYDLGRFSPQLQVGGVLRFDEYSYDPDNPPLDDSGLKKGNYADFFFNLALPFAFLYEHTAPILEINGVFGDQGYQLFITPAVTFLPEGSPALISFACQIPVLSNEFRESEGFRVLVNFSYRFDVLSIPAVGGEEEEASSDETPPAGW